MMEQQVLEEAELCNRVIRSPHSLLALQASNSHADMRRSYHVYIIGPITNGKGSFFWVPSTHHTNNLSFLLRADTASKNDVSTLAKVDEFLNEIIVLLNCMQRFAGHNYRIVSSLFCQALVSKSFYNFNSDSLWLNFLKHKHVHCIVKKLARMTDIYCCFNFITGQHPELHSRFLDIIDSFTNLILQFVFNCC